MTSIEQLGPAVDRILEDKDLQKSLKKTMKSGGSALRRASRKKNPKKAVKDHRVQQQALAALNAAREAVDALNEPPKKPKSRWLKRVFFLGLLGAGIYLAVDQEARSRLMDLAGAAQEEAAGPEPSPPFTS